MVAAPPPGGPAHRIASDYAPPGGGEKKGGRKVASKAGEKRYGLPIGTPLGQGKAKNEKDAYDRFMSQGTPAELNKAASWMSNGDLALTAKAVFGVNSKNERNQAAQMALVKELAQRGIDPHKLGYRGGYVPLNPNPKKDPTIKKAAKGEERTSLDAEKLSDDDLDILRRAGWKGDPNDQREALYPPPGAGPVQTRGLSDYALDTLLKAGWRQDPKDPADQLHPPKSRIEKERQRVSTSREAEARKAQSTREREQRKRETEEAKARKLREAEAKKAAKAAAQAASRLVPVG